MEEIWYLSIMSKKTRNSLADEMGERYHLNHAIVVKLYHPDTQFPRNVRLCHRRICHGPEQKAQTNNDVSLINTAKNYKY